MRDYLREIDLNPPPAMGGPINNPLDPRAMHYFGFLSEGQEIVQALPSTGPAKVFVSWDYANNPLLPPAPPIPPPPVDAILDFAGGPPVVRYETHHERCHAIVWLDPNAAPPPTGPMIVRVRAWATK